MSFSVKNVRLLQGKKEEKSRFRLEKPEDLTWKEPQPFKEYYVFDQRT